MSSFALLSLYRLVLSAGCWSVSQATTDRRTGRTRPCVCQFCRCMEYAGSPALRSNRITQWSIGLFSFSSTSALASFFHFFHFFHFSHSCQFPHPSSIRPFAELSDFSLYILVGLSPFLACEKADGRPKVGMSCPICTLKPPTLM